MLQWLHLCNGGPIDGYRKGFDVAVRATTRIGQDECFISGVWIQLNKGIVLGVIGIMLQWLHLCNGGPIGGYGKCFDVAIVAGPSVCEGERVTFHMHKGVIVSNTRVMH